MALRAFGSGLLGFTRFRLLRLARDERGMALPTAMFATVASLGLAGAAVMSSVDVQRGSQRDSGSKSAIAAADAGANVAMLRLNREREDLGPSTPCLDEAAPVADWCPAVTGSVGTAAYSYRVSAYGVPCADGQFDLCVSVVGSAGEVSRRILLSFDQGAPGPGGGGKEEEGEEGEGGEEGSGGGTEGLIGKDKITIGGSADVRVNIGTNGNVEGEGGSHSVCGSIRHGIGKEVEDDVNQECGGSVTEGNIDLPPVTSFMPADIATNNANARITKCDKSSLPVNCQTVSWSNWNNPPFDPGTRRISLIGNQTLTLPEGDYWICQLSLDGGSELIMQAGHKVRLFFDTPENCGTSSPMKLTGNVKIKATGYDASTLSYEMPGFFFLGSETTASSIELSGEFGTINELVVYAPNTDVKISGKASFKGMFVGETIEVTGKASFENDDGFVLPPWLNPWPEEEEDPGEEEEEEEPQVPGFYTPQFYVECTGAEAPEPDANC